MTKTPIHGKLGGFRFENNNKPMSEKYVAVRLKSIHHGEERFSAKGSTIINSRMEKREPALKNISDALYDLGLDYEIDKQGMVWFLIDDDQSAEEHLCYADIEIAFDASWYETQKARIRGYTGMHYYDACVELAKGFSLKDQTRLISDAKLEKAKDEASQSPTTDQSPATDNVVHLPAKERKPKAKRVAKVVNEVQLELF